MTKDDVTRMAREAGFTNPEKFTTTDANIQGILFDFWENLERFAALVAAAEREACADLVDCNAMAFDNPIYRSLLQANAAAIRAMEKT